MKLLDLILLICVPNLAQQLFFKNMEDLDVGIKKTASFNLILRLLIFLVTEEYIYLLY